MVAEVKEVFEAYEQALQTDDLEALDNAFWDSPAVVRFGINENLYGAEAVARYRRSTPPRTCAGPCPTPSSSPLATTVLPFLPSSVARRPRPGARPRCGPGSPVAGKWWQPTCR